MHERGAATRSAKSRCAGADLLVETRQDGIITFAAGAFRQRMGYAPEDAVGKPLRLLLQSVENFLCITFGESRNFARQVL